MSLLTITQDVCREVGVSVPSSVINNSDTTVQQVLALINTSGRTHMKNFVLEALTKEATFTTVATEEQDDITDIASDFDRIIGRTMYDRSNTWRVFGPVSAAEWQRRKSTQISSIRNVFRIRGGKILFNPAPAAGLDVYFEYISNQWVENAAGDTPRAKFERDDDVSLIDEELLKKDAKWRFLAAKGFSYAEAFREYQIDLANLVGTDGGKDTIDMSVPAGPENIMPAVPDGGWDVS
ncbi:MAG: hypothetical protein GC149_20350 [Gammaproteobacteria bacterium]|nr:hypothetical protein [Gammaproteobacteria bacterium]